MTLKQQIEQAQKQGEEIYDTYPNCNSLHMLIKNCVVEELLSLKNEYPDIEYVPELKCFRLYHSENNVAVFAHSKKVKLKEPAKELPEYELIEQ